jgi:hypothetical protein
MPSDLSGLEFAIQRHLPVAAPSVRLDVCEQQAQGDPVVRKVGLRVQPNVSIHRHRVELAFLYRITPMVSTVC